MCVVHIGHLLKYLKKKKPKDAFCIVGITMIDLYPKDSWNFVFGQASLTEGMSDTYYIMFRLVRCVAWYF